ncbi:hypothetical protein Golob_026287 [Gossypium lobatum]|uniref:Uncharacterized protein n=1 Tax=Gossypium lobatum TaxID=34289 RepID=A0A7J8LUX8_9ROSI|nr:hypothetical protein [Gossypium lobatum]
MSSHKFKDYSMVKMDKDVRVANATPWVPCALESTVSQHVMTILNVKPRNKNRTLPITSVAM